MPIIRYNTSRLPHACVPVVVLLSLLFTSLCAHEAHATNQAQDVWSIVRDGPRDLDFKSERHRFNITGFVVTEDQEHMASCAADGEVNVYRVSRYPNVYTHWTHLYYAKMQAPLITPSRGDSQTQSNDPKAKFICAMSPNGGALFRVGPSHDGKSFVLTTAAAYDVNGLNNRDPIISFGAHKPSWRSLEVQSNDGDNPGPLSSFHVIHPRDHFDFAWLHEDSVRKLQQRQVELENLPKHSPPVDYLSHSFGEVENGCKPVIATISLWRVPMLHDERTGMNVSAQCDAKISCNGNAKAAPWAVAYAAGLLLNVHVQGQQTFTAAHFSRLSEVGQCIRSIAWVDYGSTLVGHVGDSLHAWKLSYGEDGDHLQVVDLEWSKDQQTRSGDVLAVAVRHVDGCHNSDINDTCSSARTTTLATLVLSIAEGNLRGIDMVVGTIPAANAEEHPQAVVVATKFVVTLVVPTNEDSAGWLGCTADESFVTISPDARLYVAGCSHSNRIYVVHYHLSTHPTEITVARSHWFTIDGMPSAGYIYQFSKYYVMLAIGNNMVWYSSGQEWPAARGHSSSLIAGKRPSLSGSGGIVIQPWSGHPLANIGDFYLPPIGSLSTTPMTLSTLLSSSVQEFGVLTAPGCVVLVVFLAILLRQMILMLDVNFEHVADNKWIRFVSSSRFYYIVVFGLFLFSLFEISAQPAFVNDWPAHIRHVEQWIEDGVSRYDRIMHFHGPCTYPAGFMLLYGSLYKVVGGSLQCYQFFWACLEAFALLLVRSLVDICHLPPLCALLAAASNRLHLFNVRVVVNDLPVSVMVLAAIRFATFDRWWAATIMWGLALTQKLNVILYAPSVALAYYARHGLKWTALHGVVVAIIQVIVALPFVWNNDGVEPYIRNAYDLSRTLLWDKTRSFRWIGRIVYNHPAFAKSLLFMGFVLTLLVSVPYAKTLSAAVAAARTHTAVTRKQSRGGTQLIDILHKNPNYCRQLVMLMLSSNLVMCFTARGMYTPFLCWFFYTLPIACHGASMGNTATIVVWMMFESLWRVLGGHETEVWTSFILFIVQSSIVFALVKQANLSHRTLTSTTTQKVLPRGKWYDTTNSKGKKD